MNKNFNLKLIICIIITAAFLATAIIYGCTSCDYTPDDNSSEAVIDNSEASGVENSIIDSSATSVVIESSEPSGDTSNEYSEGEHSEASKDEESVDVGSDVSSEASSEHSSDASSGETSKVEKPPVDTSDNVSNGNNSEDVSKDEKPPVENSDTASKPEDDDSDFVFNLDMAGGNSQSRPYMMENHYIYVKGTVYNKTVGIEKVIVSGGGERENIATINNDGSFSIKVSVNKPNTAYKMTFTATDNSGETVSIVRYVYWERLDPPGVYFIDDFTSADNPKCITVTPAATAVSYSFEGYVYQMDGFVVNTVTVNGVAATLTQRGAGWNWSIKLSDLPVNAVIKLTVVAKNNIGKTTTVERYVYFDSPSPTEKRAFAIYSADDNSLTFYNRVLTATVGDMYNGKMVTEIYTGFDTAAYNSASETPWYSARKNITAINFEDDIVAPASTAYWFNGFTECANIDLRKLNVRQVTNMTNMFYMAGRYADTLTIVGIQSWDTSNVTNMTNMFCLTGQKATFSLDLSEWNVSNISSYTDFNDGVEDKVIAPDFE